MKFFFILILFTTNAFSFEITKDCNIELKNKRTFLKCDDGTKGYINNNESISQAVIIYRDVVKDKTLTLENVKLNEISSVENLQKLLKSKGLKSISIPKLDVVNINDETPLFKDPEKLILSSGCNFNNAPVVVSCTELEKCNSNICLGTMTCVSKKRKSNIDVACKAKVVTGGVECPSALECATDKRVIISKPTDKKKTLNSEENYSKKGMLR